MKKMFFSLVFTAISVFGVDFTGMSNLAVVDSIKKGDIVSYADVGFELSKRASIENIDTKDACLVYTNMLKEELIGKSIDQRRAFKNELNVYFYGNLAKLDKSQRDRFDRRICCGYEKRNSFNAREFNSSKVMNKRKDMNINQKTSCCKNFTNRGKGTRMHNSQCVLNDQNHHLKGSFSKKYNQDIRGYRGSYRQ
ncbi:MAG: hypothetical protein GXZ15_03350 [Campylobacter sp.]|nr:hypothetical protein [Campylobacter sp.]